MDELQAKEDNIVRKLISILTPVFILFNYNYHFLEENHDLGY